MTQRMYIHPSELAALEDCSLRTAIRRLKRIKPAGRVTFEEYAASRRVKLVDVLENLKLG